MTSRIYSGMVEHARLHPVEHRFRTPVTFFALQLDELDLLDTTVSGFGCNRRAPLRFNDQDYLTDGPDGLLTKLTPWIATCGLEHPPDRITLVTSLRWLGYVFNPVSFYILEREETAVGLIAEVNNTFGDRHVYAVPLEKKDGMLQQWNDKEFHVSPFNNLEGEYQFTFRQEEEELYIGVDLYREGKKVIETWIEGSGRPLTSRNLRRTMLLHPLRPWLTMPRIAWQAFLLKFRKKLPAFKRPEPDHAHTLYSRGASRNR